MCTNDHTEQTKPNFVCDALNPFLQSTSFKEKYISVQNITAFSTKSVYLFLAEWLGTPQKKILAKINCDSAYDTSSDDTSSDDTSSNTKITSHDLTGFSHTIDDITIKVLVSPATTKEEAPPLVASPPMRKNNPDNTNDKKNNCPHRISFFYKDIYIFEYKRNSNGAADLITRRIFSTSPDTITLFVFIILYLSIQFNISTYRGQRLDWTTSENLMNSAAAIELIIYRNLSTSETSYNHRIKKRLLKNYITKRFSQEHLRNVNIVESINDRYIKTNWNVQVESMRRNLSFSSNSENLEKLNNVIAEKIVQTAPRYPLLSSILHIKNDNPQSIENIINLLRQICVITLKLRSAENIEVRVFIKPIIASTLQSFDGAFNFLEKKPRKYTKLDVLIFLGQLSQKMSAEADYSIAKSEMTQFCQAYTAADTATEIFNDLITDAVGILIMNDTHYQFRHKQSRLVFFGIYSGMCENNSSETIKGINLLNLITENASSNQKTKEHIRWKYDNSVIFGCAFLNTLTNKKREAVLEDLCQIARNAEPKNRNAQEKAIALLSYYLCEGTQYSGKQRERIFHSSYAKDLYFIQETMWEYLKSSTPIYHETINNCLQQACVLDNTGKYARCDPYYIFLWWNYSGETTTAISFLKEACTIQHESWFGNNNSISDLDNIFSKIRIAVSRLEQSRENNILPYVYSLNMLLLSLANLRILKYVFNSHFEIYDTVMMQISANSGDLIHAVILCDYYTRKFNYTYNEGKANCRITDLFLLSGAIRFLCSYHLKPDSRVNLGGMMQDYISWYKNEHGRWKILLARLLSYTDFFSAANTEIVSEEEYKCANFLKYDNVPETYTDFRNEINKDFRNEIDKRSSK